MTLKTLKKMFVFLALLTFSLSGLAQETTGSLQGVVKDPSGAVVPHAKVTVSTPTLTGPKTVETDSKGYYHIQNLPPGPYVITAEAKGFATLKRDGVVLEVGHSPSVDLKLTVGAESAVVNISSESPVIDVTSVTTQTNVTQDVLDYVPHGTSFQSVIQFAPGASNEPLMGSTGTNGSGAVSPGSGTNGNAYGYSIAGGSDSENSYLVEGQETANLIGGYSHTNVPTDFIDQVQIKSSGIQSEYGGALGGVINVIMKKGTSSYHGSVFMTYGNSKMDASPSAYPRYDPLGNETPEPGWKSASDSSLPACSATITTGCQPAPYLGFLDAPYQSYQPVKPRTSYVFPGFTLGGPLLPMFSSLRDKVFFFVAFNPELNRYAESINYGPVSAGSAAVGVLPYSQNTNTYYTTARVDAQVTKKIRLFGSWLYQFQKQYGEHLPSADSLQGFNYTTGTGFYNNSVSTPVSSFAHTLGYSAPNLTLNTGADITITPSIVSTTRFGYYFENYHDFGYPTGGDVFVWNNNGIGATDTKGNPLPSSLQQNAGHQTGPLDNLTAYNSNKAIELDQDISWYKSTALGTHNFKFGYQLSRKSNLISQVYNEPQIQLNVGDGGTAVYSPQTSTGQNTTCPALTKANGGCQGQYGYLTLYDYGTGGKAISYNHSIYFQDSWTVGRGVTIDAGVRVEHENLPGEIEGYSASVVPPDPISFGWKQKIAPRIGASWDVFKNGKLKMFGSYGVFNDQMKLNLAISSFGGQYWNNCVYALNTSNLASITVPFGSYAGGERYCAGPNSSSNAVYTAPAGLSFIENVNLRAATPTCSTCNPYEEAVAPNLKPYQQHESVFGSDYQLSKTVTVEARYDRRRLDHVIEDSAIYNPAVGETFVIVNPGEGSNGTFEGFCDFLYSTDPSGCISSNGAYPPTNNIKAARSYDGVELRINKAISNHWAGMFSYTYSHFRGNYTGLTSSDIADGGAGGRNAPNNSRAFDEPYFSWSGVGTSSSGPLPTDRPNKLKGLAYYRLNYLHKFTTDLGIFSYAYEGSPNTTYGDVGLSYDAFPVDLVGRGKWLNVSQNTNTGAITVSNPYTYRNPWYIQSDFNITEDYKISGNKSINVQATFTNVFNEHAVTAVNEQVDTPYGGDQFITPGGYNITAGVPFYAAAIAGYNIQTALNGAPIGGQVSNSTTTGGSGPITVSSEYGKPLYYQLPRTVRLSVHFTF